MKDLSDRVMAAKNAVLFLAFIPGTPSITEFAAAAQKANKGLFVRGCVTSPDAAGNFYYDLKGTSPPKKQKGVKNPPAPQDARVISASALDKTVPAGWQKELLKAGFAITHDKIVVIDPFADDCVVVTGSHNLGYQASYNNDENLVIIEGNKKLAMAYATHVLDVYDHFSWRWTVNHGTSVDANLKTKPDDWLNWYFDAQGNIKTAQLKILDAGYRLDGGRNAHNGRLLNCAENRTTIRVLAHCRAMPFMVCFATAARFAQGKRVHGVWLHPDEYQEPVVVEMHAG